MNTPAKCRYAAQHLIFLPPPVCKQLHSTGCFLAPYLLLPSAERIPLTDARLLTLSFPKAFSMSVFSSLLLPCLVFRKKEIEKGERNSLLLPRAETSGYRVRLRLLSVHICVCMCAYVYTCQYMCVCISVYIPSLKVHSFNGSHQLVHLCLVCWVWMSQIYLEN